MKGLSPKTPCQKPLSEVCKDAELKSEAAIALEKSRADRAEFERIWLKVIVKR